MNTSTLSYTIFTLVSFLLISNSSQAQSRFSSELRFDFMIKGIFEPDPEVENRFTKRNLVIPGLSFAFGGKHGLYLNKKRDLKLNLGHLLEHHAFTRFSSKEFDSGYSNNLKMKFNSIYLSAPVELEYQKGKLSFTVGIVSSINLWTKMHRSSCSYSSTESCEYIDWYTVTNYFGDRFESEFTTGEVYSDKNFDFQHTFGIQYKLNQKIRLGVEFRDFLFTNILHVEYFDWDVFARDKLKQQSNSLHLSLLYKLK